jgi:hypothetical protein
MSSVRSFGLIVGPSCFYNRKKEKMELQNKTPGQKARGNMGQARSTRESETGEKEAEC